MRRWIFCGLLLWSSLAPKVQGQVTVNGRNPQLPDTLGPNGGLKVECIAGTCTGSGGAAATVAIDQTTPGTTNGVYVLNGVAVTGTFFQAVQPVSQSGTWNVGINGSIDVSDRSGRLLGSIANTSFAATQSGVWTSGRTWNLASANDSVNVGNFPSTQAVTESGTWNVGLNAGANAIGSITNTGFNVNNFPATQAVTQSGTWTTGRTWTLASGTDSVSAVPPTLTKGTQGATGFSTQNLKDAGRTFVVCNAVAVTLVTTEALLSMTCNKGGTNQGASTTYTVTSGKTFRLTSVYQSTLNLTTATLLAVDTFVRSAGACSASSPIVGYVGTRMPPATATLNAGSTGAQQFPDGVEIAAAQQICVSQVSRNTANGNVTMILTGFEY